MSTAWKASRVASSAPTIFAEMSALAVRTGSINLGQGFPDFPAPDAVKDAAARAIAAAAAIALIATAPARTAPQAPAGDAAAKRERLKWFHEAKYGLFIHWGLYAIPAGQWKGERVLGLGEWIMNRARIPVKEYEQLAAQFNPVKFDADAWVKLAQDAGLLLDRAGADTLLVVGTRGRALVGQMLIGSVTHQCLHHARGPVVVVHHRPGTGS